MSELPWDERINAISVHPQMATADDVARMAAELHELREVGEWLKVCFGHDGWLAGVALHNKCCDHETSGGRLRCSCGCEMLMYARNKAGV